MNCHEFQERMQACLDDRLSLRHDRKLRRHAERCETCRGEMAVWQVIERTISSHPVHFGGRLSRLIWFVPAIAATLLFAVAIPFWLDSTGSDKSTASAEPSLLGIEAVSLEDFETSDDAPSFGSARPGEGPNVMASWWPRIESTNWLDRAMPTVKSVQHGVAPIGRSLVRALTILTVGNRSSTS